MCDARPTRCRRRAHWGRRRRRRWIEWSWQTDRCGRCLLYTSTAPLWSRSARTHGGFVGSFFLFSLLAVCSGLYFRPHYFVLVLPAAALCTGIGVCAVRQTVLEKRFGRRAGWLPVLYFAVVIGISVRGQYKTCLLYTSRCV